jgi:hypothetical protein
MRRLALLFQASDTVHLDEVLVGGGSPPERKRSGHGVSSSDRGRRAVLVSAPPGSALHHRRKVSVSFVLGAEVAAELVGTVLYLLVEAGFSSGYQNV